MLLIKNGKIFTMTGLDYEKGYVLADDNGKISAIGDMKDFDNAVKASIVIDAEGKYVLPGFIDAHCHIGLVEDAVRYEGNDHNESTDPITPQLRASDGIYHIDRAFAEARENGVTTVITGPGSANVIGGQFAAMKTYGRRIEEMIIKEPVAIKAAFGENPKTVYKGKNKMPMTRMATAALLRETLIKAKKYKERIDENIKDAQNAKKPDYDMKMEALLKVLNKEIPIKAHAHRADDILTALRIAREFDINITIEHCTEGHLIKDILKEEGVSVVIGPLLIHRYKNEHRNLSMETPGILANEGLKVAIMTDHPCVPVKLLVFCAAIAVREGMSEEDAFRAITINAAEITGIADRVGSLELGKDADIVIFDNHPFDIRSRVTQTIINGRVIYERALKEAGK